MAAKGFILYFFSKTVCVMVSLCLLVNVDKNWLLSSGFFFSGKKEFEVWKMDIQRSWYFDAALPGW